MARARRRRPGGTGSRTRPSTSRVPIARCFDEMLPDATQVADPFHVVKLANSKLDECRRRVQNETMGHRGTKDRSALSLPAAAHQGRRAPRGARAGEAARAACVPATRRAR